MGFMDQVGQGPERPHMKRKGNALLSLHLSWKLQGWWSRLDKGKSVQDLCEGFEGTREVSCRLIRVV